MNSLSTTGIVHTLVSVLAIPLGVAALVQRGRFDLKTKTAQLYVLAAFVGTVTAFGVIRTPPGLGIAIASLLTVVVGVVASRFSAPRAQVASMISLSASFFFVLLPGATETLTRLPVDAPFASSPQAPVVLAAQGLLFLGLVLGMAWQVRARPRLLLA
jgi:hypothetical protein